mgnify:CR=1 FL=1|jgi:hypothetical protein
MSNLWEIAPMSTAKPLGRQAGGKHAARSFEVGQQFLKGVTLRLLARPSDGFINPWDVANAACCPISFS